jgi:ribose 1,5-bisphosphokinase
VSVVEITAPPEILARRIAARGRAQDGDLAARLAREGGVTADLTILNTGAADEAAARLVAHLRAC